MRGFGILLTALLLLLASCQKQLPEFAYLKATDQANLIVKLGDKLTITTDDEKGEEQFTINGDTLIVFGDADAILTIPQDKISMLTNIIADSNADLVMDTSIVWLFNNGLFINISGNADAHLAIAAPTVSITLKDNADLWISADTATSVTLSATDQANLFAENFQVKRYEINVSGSADAYIYATEAIAGSVSDEAIVLYRGTPDTSQVTVSDDATFAKQEE